jgi:acyl-CoA thioesterase I
MLFMLSIGSVRSMWQWFLCPAGVRSYGARRTFQQIAVAFSVVFAAETMAQFAHAETRSQTPIHVVALGDSLTAGLGLAVKEGFVPRLQAALAAKGVATDIANAGVSGDTASDGLARLDWSVPPGTDAVIVELGANDMLRGIDPRVTRNALDAILTRLAERHIAVLLCGMKAAPNLGAEYGKRFDGIYPDLAAKYGLLLYPFFLDGVAANAALIQSDGLHPNAAGVDVIVGRTLPKIEELIARVRAQKQT